MATRKMKEMGPGMAGTTPVNERRLVPQGTANSANDPVEPVKLNDLSQFPDVQGMTRGSATDILKTIQKANKTK